MEFNSGVIVLWGGVSLHDFVSFSVTNCASFLFLCDFVSSYHLSNSYFKQLFPQEALSGGLTFLVRLSLLLCLLSWLFCICLCDYQINPPLPLDCVSPTIHSQHQLWRHLGQANSLFFNIYLFDCVGSQLPHMGSSSLTRD